MMSLERIKGETMATEEKNSNVLTKALSILEYMSRQKKRVSIQELSQELGISSPSVHRILQALKADGYIQQEKNKQYSLTYKLLELSSYSNDARWSHRAGSALYELLCAAEELPGRPFGAVRGIHPAPGHGRTVYCIQ